MQIDQAKAIPMTEILAILGFEPTHPEGEIRWYFSLLHKGKVASLCVNIALNTWSDFVTDKRGNSIDFVCAYLESQEEEHTVFDALRWLDNIVLSGRQKPFNEPSFHGHTYHLQTLSNLKDARLTKFLLAKGIPLDLAKKHLREASVLNSTARKTFCALSIPNENGGHALLNGMFDGHIAPAGISFIRGLFPLPDEVHVFANIIDFLSALIYQPNNRFVGDAVILHSTGNLPDAYPYLKNYGYKVLYSWLGNSQQSTQMNETLKTFSSNHDFKIFKALNQTFEGYQDYNAWHLHKV